MSAALSRNKRQRKGDPNDLEIKSLKLKPTRDRPPLGKAPQLLKENVRYVTHRTLYPRSHGYT